MEGRAWLQAAEAGIWLMTFINTQIGEIARGKGGDGDRDRDRDRGRWESL